MLRIAAANGEVVPTRWSDASARARAVFEDAIDANIASAGVDEEVGARPVRPQFPRRARQRFLCPRTPPTEQHQP
jgi:hypothetical protein